MYPDAYEEHSNRSSYSNKEIKDNYKSRMHVKSVLGTIKAGSIAEAQEY